MDGDSAWRRWIGNARFWLIDLVRGTSSLALLRELEYLQFAPCPVLAARQRARRDAYAAAVRKHCALYRNFERFEQFPIIDKAFANVHRAGLTNPAYRGRVVRKKTGGSTGEPFVYATGVLAQSYLWAAILLSWRVAGYRLGEPVAFLAGSALFGSGRKQRLYYALMNVRLWSAFDMSAARMDQCCAELAASGCRLLYGYAAAIDRLAQHILDGGERRRFRLRGVVCTAEVLSAPMRARIEQAFGARCFSQYGCNDAGVSAYECEQRKGYHLITERCWHEVGDDARLLASDMANDAFFLPRYDTGDRVRLSTQACPCGRGFPLITAVLGRANDMVADPFGNAVHSEFFTHLFREDAAIRAFQVLYDSDALLVIVHGACAAAAQQRYLERIGAILQFGSLQLLLDRPFLSSNNGKHRFVLRVDSVPGALAGTPAS